MLLNGFPMDVRTFSRVTAYVEQADIHAPYATVREALEFSAKLRLPSEVPSSQVCCLFCFHRRRKQLHYLPSAPRLRGGGAGHFGAAGDRGPQGGRSGRCGRPLPWPA